MHPVTAFVLAGGQSSRMGRDKAFLHLAGQTLLERALELARSVSDSAYIVGQKDKFAAYGAVIEDLYPGHGPLAGIHTALRFSATDLNLVLGVDTPFLEPRFLAYLVDEATASSTLVTLPRIGGRNHPLCAVYRREFADHAEASLRAGRNKIDPLFASTPTRLVEDAELRKLSFEPGMFDNLNTPQEWEQACRRARK